MRPERARDRLGGIVEAFVDTAKLLNFGAGTHYCLGTALAKIAVEESLRALLAADPPLRLTEDPAAIPWRQVLGRSPARLPVTSEAAA
jgi:cytochrome P450